MNKIIMNRLSRKSRECRQQALFLFVRQSCFAPLLNKNIYLERACETFSTEQVFKNKNREKKNIIIMFRCYSKITK